MKGAALITALFIMTLVAIAATSMSLNLQINIYRTHLKINADKAYLASQTVSFWAMSKLLKTCAKKSLNKPCFIPNPLVFPEKDYRYPGAHVEGSLNDLQSFYNINNLIDDKAIPGFLNLLKHLLPKASNIKRQRLALAIANWVRPAKSGYIPGDNYYTQQKPPYLASHVLITDLSELKLIKEIDPVIYGKLYPHLTALPEQTKINLNTASATVLYGLGYTINSQHVETITQARMQKGGITPKKLTTLLEELPILKDASTLSSHYFLTQAKVHIGQQSLINFTTLKLTKESKKKTKASIIKESFNIR